MLQSSQYLLSTNLFLCILSGAISEADRVDRGKTIFILHTLLLTMFKFYGNIRFDIKVPWLQTHNRNFLSAENF